MKNKILRLAIGSILIGACVTWGVSQLSCADQFVTDFARRMHDRNVEVTKHDQDILRQVHPFLIRAADDKTISSSFWVMVRQAPVKEIAWAEAVKLIQSGMVISVFQSHSLEVDLTTKDGRRFTTKEPEIDRVYKVCYEVDPKCVFMRYATE
jgi:sensor c-di-GMP phosphodiesterase-like protein